ncbi:MAG TPA: glutamine-hydrolyzing carbamoyl-phosphate synthase small subunit [Bacillota bacterium]|jgi:carbamoyl-phosphate synthase small subunit
MIGRLVLEDGTAFEGEAFGATREQKGEVVFNTGMTGYQEVLTDPSYCGQIVTMTYPLIGNYGLNGRAVESRRPWVKGFLVSQYCHHPSHRESTGTIDEYLTEQGIMGLAGLDTRALTKHLRERGTMLGILTTAHRTVDELAHEARATRLEGLVGEVSTPRPYHVFGDGPRVVVLDFGVKYNILRSLQAYDCDTVVVPAATGAEDILDFRPDAVLLSNGPGDPKDVPMAVKTVRELIGRVPIFGICLGHQLLALALGADTYKLKYGHRGANHPVKDLAADHVRITTQNHGYAVDESSLDGTGLLVTHRNLNDETVEGLRHEKYRAFGVQYHPEAAPGPRDSTQLFGQFLAMAGRA